jgi:hypothetical protein
MYALMMPMHERGKGNVYSTGQSFFEKLKNPGGGMRKPDEEGKVICKLN